MSARYWTILLLTILALLYFLPAHEANLDQVRGALSLRVLNEYDDADLVKNMKVLPGSRADRAVARSHGVKVKPAIEDGIHAEEEVDSDFEAKTKSYCFEIKPRCLNVEQEQVLRRVRLRLSL